MGYGVMIGFITLDHAAMFLRFCVGGKGISIPKGNGDMLADGNDGAFTFRCLGRGLEYCILWHLSQACKSPNRFC